jgi:hypothetical protein
MQRMQPIAMECRPLLHDAARPLQQSLQRAAPRKESLQQCWGGGEHQTDLLWREQPAMGRRRE